MCDPLTIGAAVLGGGGMLASQMGYDQAASARAAVMQRQQAQQDALAAQQRQTFGGILDKFSPTNQTAAQNTAVNTRQNAITSAMAPAAGITPTDGMNPNAPRVVRDAATAAIGNVNTLAAGEGNALARQGSFGDLMTGNTINLNRAGQNIGNLASFSQGDANLLPLQLQAANQQGRGLHSMGDLLSHVGMLAGYASALNGADAYGSTPSAPKFGVYDWSGSGPFGYGRVNGNMTYGQLLAGS